MQGLSPLFPRRIKQRVDPRTRTAILLIRLLAMYGNPRGLKIGLSLAFLAEVILLFALLIAGTSSLEGLPCRPYTSPVTANPMPSPLQ